MNEFNVSKKVEIDIGDWFGELTGSEKCDFINEAFDDLDAQGQTDVIAFNWGLLTISQQDEALELFVDTLTDKQKEKLKEYLEDSI